MTATSVSVQAREILINRFFALCDRFNQFCVLPCLSEGLVDTPVQARGEHKMKGIVEPQAVFALQSE